MVLHRRHLRLALYAGLGWIIAEAALFWLVAGQIGFFPTLLVMTVKGIGGFMLMAGQLRKILGKVALRDLKNGFAAISDAGFLALGAFLIFLPGFIPTLAGLALFAPSVRMRIVAWLNREKARQPADGVITLDPREWQELAGSERQRPVEEPRPQSRKRP
jgi:UPF0716 family protein affecting phage T7 exclusion